MTAPFTTLYEKNELFQRIADGDEKAFRILFDVYKDRFYAVARKMTRSESIAEEMVQEVFIKIWQYRTNLTQVTNPDSYFFTMLYRQVYSHYKKLALNEKMLTLITRSPVFQNITDEAVLARESEKLINEAVAKLPTQQRLVFKMSKQEGLSREQIAEKLRISPNTVRNHLTDALSFVRTYLYRALFLLCAAIVYWWLK